MKQSFINFIIRSPKKSIFFSILFILSSIFGYLNIQSDFSYKVWYDRDNPGLNQFKEFESKFGNDDNIMVSVHSKDGIFNAKTLNLIKKLSEELNLVQDILRVDSILDYPEIKSYQDDIKIDSFINEEEINNLSEQDFERIKNKAISDESLKNWFVSEDGTLSVLTATMRPGFEDPPPYVEIDRKIEKLLAKYSNENISLYRAGAVTITRFYKDATYRDVYVVVPLVIFIFILILFYLYRSFYCVLLTFILLTLSDFMMIGYSFMLGFKINTLSSASPTILLTVAMADAIHLLTSFFIGLEKFNNKEEAIRYSLDKNYYPTLLTTLTTSLGFLSFGIAGILPIAWMGIGVAIGVVCAWILSYTLFAPLLLLGFKVSKQVTIKQQSFQLTGLSQFVIGNAKLIVLLGCIIMGWGIYFGSKLEINMEPLSQFKDNHYLVKTSKFLKTKLGAVNTFEIMINSPEEDGIKDPMFLKKIEDFQAWLVSQPKVTTSTSILNILKNINKALNSDDTNFHKIPDTKKQVAEELLLYQFSVPEGKDITNLTSIRNDSLRILGRWDIESSKDGLKIIDDIKLKLDRLGLDGTVTGKSPLIFGLVSEIVRTLGSSFLMAVVCIGLMLIIILKSVRLGLLSLVPNILPIIAGAAVFYFIGSGIDLGVVLVASVCLGIAVDDSIHFLFEYKKNKEKGLSIEDNFTNIYNYTLPSLSFTTFLLFIGFASFFMADYIPNVKFGLMTALILLMALISDIFFLPAVLYLAERDKGKVFSTQKNKELIK